MRLGRPAVVIFGSFLIVLAMPTIALGAVAGLPLLTAAGLFLFGGGMGSGEVAMNVEGADVEALGKRPFLPALHGCFSLGTVIGAGLGILANAVSFSVVAHLVLTGALGARLAGMGPASGPTGTGRVTAQERAEQADTRPRAVGRPAGLIRASCWPWPWQRAPPMTGCRW